MNYRRWTDDDTNALIRFILEGRSYEYISSLLDRTVAAISSKITMLRSDGVALPTIYSSRRKLNYKGDGWNIKTIKETMLDNKITQVQLANVTGLTKVTICNVLNGKSNGSERTRELINNNIFTKEE